MPVFIYPIHQPPSQLIHYAVPSITVLLHSLDRFGTRRRDIVATITTPRETLGILRAERLLHLLKVPENVKLWRRGYMPDLHQHKARNDEPRTLKVKTRRRSSFHLYRNNVFE